MAKKRAQADAAKIEAPRDSEWILLRYQPVSLFSLRMTHATNKGGKTLVVPTPYSVKMALIDACFRAFPAETAPQQARALFHAIKKAIIRFRPPGECVVQNTFVKIRQDERDAESGFYTSTIAYREWVYYQGDLCIALSIGGVTEAERTLVQAAASHINHFGKRGCFWQFVDAARREGQLPQGFTMPQGTNELMRPDLYGVSQFLDDFGDSLCSAKDGFERISTYHDGKITLGQHRVLIPTLIPYVRVHATRSFTQYECRSTEM